MDEHTSNRLHESDKKKFQYSSSEGDDEDDERKVTIEVTEANVKAISNKYSSRDEEDAALKKQRTYAWNSSFGHLVDVHPSSDSSESFMDDSEELSSSKILLKAQRMKDNISGSRTAGVGEEISQGSFDRNESLDATRPPQPNRARRTLNHRNTDPGAISMFGELSPQTSDRTIHVGDMEDDDSPDIVTDGYLVGERSQERGLPSVAKEPVVAVPMLEEDKSPKGIRLIFRNRQVGCTVVLLVIVAASLVAGLLLSGGSNDSPSLSISLLADLLRDSVEDATPWENTKSPQYRALDWLSNEDEWTAEQMEAGNLNIPLQILLERYALVVLFMAWDGNSWNNNSWMLVPNLSTCDWNASSDSFLQYSEPYGVVCGDDSFVSGFSLLGVGATGEIPTELLLLSSLEYLLLDSNYLRGTISPELFLLPKLNSLSLSGNDLEGSIPSEVGLAANLQMLDLSGNGILSGMIPSEIGLAANLRKLNLSNSVYSGTLDSVVNPRLEQLDLSGNGLGSSIPPTFGNMTLLERLDLFDNFLTGSLPSALANMHSLTYLSLKGNRRLTGTVPEALSSMNLSHLYLENTGLRNVDVCFADETVRQKKGLIIDAT
eukprot:scaffold3467_cov118-Cylindrotheca_fusiformis.AAC.5